MNERKKGVDSNGQPNLRQASSDPVAQNIADARAAQAMQPADGNKRALSFGEDCSKVNLGVSVAAFTHWMVGPCGNYHAVS